MYANQFRVYMGRDPAGAQQFWQGCFFSKKEYARMEKVTVRRGTEFFIAEVHQSTRSSKTPSDSLFVVYEKNFN